MLSTILPKYAHTDRSKTYHLMGSKTKTLCGLSVLPIVLESDVNAPALHLIKRPPISCLICKHCTRVQREMQLSATDENHQLLKTA